MAVLGKANIYHKPRKTGFGKFVKFLDLISAKYIRPFPLCPVLSKSISFYPASQSLSSRKTEFSGPKFISLFFILKLFLFLPQKIVSTTIAFSKKHTKIWKWGSKCFDPIFGKVARKLYLQARE